MTPTGNLAKNRTRTNVGVIEPGPQSRYRANYRILASCNSDLDWSTPAAIGRPHQGAETVFTPGNMRHVNSGYHGSSKRPSEGEQQQGPVAQSRQPNFWLAADVFLTGAD
jgi:hypothetical protein